MYTWPSLFGTLNKGWCNDYNLDRYNRLKCDNRLPVFHKVHFDRCTVDMAYSNYQETDAKVFRSTVSFEECLVCARSSVCRLETSTETSKRFSQIPAGKWNLCFWWYSLQLGLQQVSLSVVIIFVDTCSNNRLSWCPYFLARVFQYCNVTELGYSNVYCFVAVSGLKCYSCLTGDSCADPFKKDQVSIVPCGDGEVCQKFLATVAFIRTWI